MLKQGAMAFIPMQNIISSKAQEIFGRFGLVNTGQVEIKYGRGELRNDLKHYRGKRHALE
jgi:hypothetical protein